MGSSQSQNDDFSRNFNIAEHQRKMASLNKQYQHHDLNIPSSRPIQSKQENYHKLDRHDALYKTSFKSCLEGLELRVQIEYDSSEGCILELFVGVQNVEEDSVSNVTTGIRAAEVFKSELKPGKKVLVGERFKTSLKSLKGATIILRLCNNRSEERSEYSFREMKEGWKCLLQKFEKGGTSYQLQNIYKGGEDSQECIVCMTDASDTLVKPCNHMCMCKECSVHIKQSTNVCPICRKAISMFVTVGGM